MMTIKNVVVIVVWLAFAIACQKDITEPEAAGYDSYFGSVREPSYEYPFLIGYPKGGASFRVGDTMEIVFKRHARVRAYCAGIELVGSFNGLIALESRSDSFTVGPFFGLDPILYEREDDIEIVKWRIKDSIMATHGRKIPVQNKVWDLKLSEDVLMCGEDMNPSFVRGVTIR